MPKPRIDAVEVLHPVAVVADAAPRWITTPGSALKPVGLLHDRSDPHAVEAHARDVIKLGCYAADRPTAKLVLARAPAPSALA